MGPFYPSEQRTMESESRLQPPGDSKLSGIVRRQLLGIQRKIGFVFNLYKLNNRDQMVDLGFKPDLSSSRVLAPNAPADSTLCRSVTIQQLATTFLLLPCPHLRNINSFSKEFCKQKTFIC